MYKLLKKRAFYDTKRIIPTPLGGRGKKEEKETNSVKRKLTKLWLAKNEYRNREETILKN